MSLAAYQFAQTEIAGGLTVRGLSYVDITKLANEHFVMLSKIFEGIEVGKEESFDVRKIVGKFGPATAPLVASIIAFGCGEPDNTAIASKLPFGVQVEAVTKIGEHTFAIEGGAKRVFQLVMMAMQHAGAVMTDRAV